MPSVASPAAVAASPAMRGLPPTIPPTARRPWSTGAWRAWRAEFPELTRGCAISKQGLGDEPWKARQLRLYRLVMLGFDPPHLGYSILSWQVKVTSQRAYRWDEASLAAGCPVHVTRPTPPGYFLSNDHAYQMQPDMGVGLA